MSANLLSLTVCHYPSSSLWSSWHQSCETSGGRWNCFSTGMKLTFASLCSQRAVVVAIVCNFLVLSLKVGVWFTTSSHVMMAEAVHSLADLANQVLASLSWCYYRVCFNFVDLIALVRTQIDFVCCNSRSHLQLISFRCKPLQEL